MEDINILEQLFDDKMLSVLRLFISGEENTYYLREISKLTKIPPATTYRILKKLTEAKVLELTVIKNAKIYSLAKNKNTDFLKNILKIEKRVIDLFVEHAKKIDGIQAIVLHGNETAKKANVLIIGEDIDHAGLKHLVSDIKDRYDFFLTTLQLTKEQFEQMSAMGLYSGKKKVLYSR